MSQSKIRQKERRYLRMANVLLIKDATAKFDNVSFVIQNKPNTNSQFGKNFIERSNLEDTEETAVSLLGRAKENSNAELHIGNAIWHIEMENILMLNKGCWTFGGVGFYLETSRDIEEKLREIVIENAVICINSSVEFASIWMLSKAGTSKTVDAAAEVSIINDDTDSMSCTV